MQCRFVTLYHTVFVKVSDPLLQQTRKTLFDVLPDINGEAIGNTNERIKLSSILSDINKMYTLRAHTKPNQTNLNTYLGPQENLTRARLPCQHAPLPNSDPLANTSKCKRPPLGVSPQGYKSPSGTTAQEDEQHWDTSILCGVWFDCTTSSLYRP